MAALCHHILLTFQAACDFEFTTQSRGFDVQEVRGIHYKNICGVSACLVTLHVVK